MKVLPLLMVSSLLVLSIVPVHKALANFKVDFLDTGKHTLHDMEASGGSPFDPRTP
jgi:hypothetical protein